MPSDILTNSCAIQDSADYLSQLVSFVPQLCSAAKGVDADQAPAGGGSKPAGQGAVGAGALAAVSLRALGAHDALTARLAIQNASFPAVAEALVAAVAAAPERWAALHNDCIEAVAPASPGELLCCMARLSDSRSLTVEGQPTWFC